MDADIDSKVRHCRRCVRQKTRPVPAAELVNVTSSAPMELVCIACLSLEMSKGRYEHILVITHHFNRYGMAVLMRNKTDRQLPGFCLTTYLHIMDFWPDFIVTRTKTLNSRWLVSRRQTTPYRPMKIGQAQRLNQTLIRMLDTLEPSRKSDWKSYVLL